MHIALVFRDIVKVYSNVSTTTTSVANKAFVLVVDLVIFFL